MYLTNEINGTIAKTYVPIDKEELVKHKWTNYFKMINRDSAFHSRFTRDFSKPFRIHKTDTERWYLEIEDDYQRFYQEIHIKDSDWLRNQFSIIIH